MTQSERTTSRHYTQRELAVIYYITEYRQKTGNRIGKPAALKTLVDEGIIIEKKTFQRWNRSRREYRQYYSYRMCDTFCGKVVISSNVCGKVTYELQ